MKDDSQRFKLLSKFSEEGENTPRAYRYCSKDVVLAAWVGRPLTRDRLYEVYLFLAEDHWKYTEDSGLKAAIMMILTHCFRVNRTMHIVFRGPGERQIASYHTGYEPVIPEKIVRVAREYGVHFRSNKEISDEEGRMLFLGLTRFAEEIIAELAQSQIDVVKLAFMVQRSIFSVGEVRAIYCWAQEPQCIFDGTLTSDNYLSYQLDALVLRSAMAARAALQLLSLPLQGQESTLSYTWNAQASIAVTTQQQLRITKDVLFPARLHGSELIIEAGETFDVLLMPHLQAEYELCAKDLFAAPYSGQRSLVVITTFDFELVSKACLTFVDTLLRQPRVTLISLVETCGGLDQQGKQLLTQCRHYLEELEVRSDD